jgi:hypothetical protein
MKKTFSVALVSAILISSSSGAFSATKVSSGTKCAKAGQTATVGKTKFTCTKSGTKLLWKLSPVSKEVAPTEPTGFENLYQNRKGVSYAAWRQVSEGIKKNNSKLGKLDIRTGPQSSPIFDKDSEVLALVSRAFPESEEPKTITIIRYQFKDLSWAENEIRGVISREEYVELDRNEGGRLLTSNCDGSLKNCLGSKQVTTQLGHALILQGIPNPKSVFDSRFTTGMLEAHEYFHSLQRIPLLGKPLSGEDWPRAWFREGSAEWVQNVTINYANFESYSRYIKSDCSNSIAGMGEGEISEFFSAKSDEEIRKYDPWLNYCLGAYGVEVLVSLKGQKSILDLYTQMSTRIGFEAAFKNVYSFDWPAAVPILAKTVFANIQGK